MSRFFVLVLVVALLPAGSVLALDMWFTDITDSTVVGDTAHTYGSCLGDYNGDGDLDIFSGNIILTSNLYRNDGGMVFVRVTEEAGFTGLVEAKGSSMADYDNDGDLDIALVGWGKDRFYINNGDGTFTDYTDQSNFAAGDSVQGMSAVWADYDGDGYVDLFVANIDGPSVLYQNQGDGTFADVTSGAGIDCNYAGTGSTWFDFDDDGDQDLFVGRYLGYPDHLYRNEGVGAFTEVAEEAGVAGADSSFGCAVGDIDGDGDLDLYVSKFNGAGSLYQNNGDGTFLDITASAGASISGCGTGCSFEDFDLDGDLDLYVGCFYTENHMLQNDGTAFFTDVTSVAGVGDYGAQRTGVGIVSGDLDGDGDVDIYCGNHKRNTLFRNDTSGRLLAAGNWLVLRLEGTSSNRSAVGAKVLVTTAAGTQVRHVTAGSGVCSMSSLQLEFGLGSDTDPEVEIRWPSGIVESGTLNSPGYVDVVEGMFPGVAEKKVSPRISDRFLLHQNRPNPFASATTIRFEMPMSGRVALRVYDVSGRPLCDLVNEDVSAGVHTVTWDGAASGDRLPEGVYICRFSVGGVSETRKMILLK